MKPVNRIVHFSFSPSRLLKPKGSLMAHLVLEVYRVRCRRRNEVKVTGKAAVRIWKNQST